MTDLSVPKTELLGSPFLRKISNAVSFPLSHESKATIEELKESLAECRSSLGFGRAIAAPQIGRPYRIVYTQTDEPRVLINPRIVRRSEERFELWDDCLSLPDLLVWVARSREVEVEYCDSDGKQQTWSAVNDMAELLQHEIDHLDGVLMIDRAVGRNSIYLREEYRRQIQDDPDLQRRGPRVLNKDWGIQGSS